MQSLDTDACVPFLLSIGQEEISAITSPCFDASSPSPGGSTLFDRLSRGLSPPDQRGLSSQKQQAEDARLPTPSTPKVDCNGSLSTIEAEHSLIEKAEEDHVSQRRLRWNGEFRSPFNQSLAGRSKSPTARANLHTLGAPHSAGTTPSDRLRSTPAAGRFSASLNRQLSQEKSACIPKHNNIHDRSVSWEISPSKGRQLASSQAKELVANTSLDTPKRPDTSVDTSALTTATKRSGRSEKNGSSDGADVWREVTDPESGRKYYYNRKTRVSRWKLPKGAVLAKKSSRRSDRSRTGEDRSLSRLQISLSSKDQSHTSEQSPISPVRHHNEAIDQGESSNATPHISFSSAAGQPETSPQRQALAHKRAQEYSFFSREESKSALEDEAFLSRRLSHQQSQRPEISMSANESQLSASLRSAASHEECKSGSFVEETFDSSPTGNSAVRETYLSSSSPEAAIDQNAAPADALRHIKSPQDCTAACVFCPYCGLRNTSVVQLSSHLSTCPQFKEMQLHGLSTQIELETTLFQAWSTLGSSKGEPPSAMEPKNVSHSLDSLNATSLGASYDDAFSEDVSRERVARKTPTPRKLRREAHASAPVIQRKNCPFCEEAFVKGNEFSCHLLKCKERRRARKERRAKKDNTPFAAEPRRKCSTPGRRMPWE